jgi:hypothetical protein
MLCTVCDKWIDTRYNAVLYCCSSCWDEAAKGEGALPRYSYSLLGLIEDLHGECSGSSECYSLDEVKAIYRTLLSRKNTWQHNDSLYDKVVFKLLNRVLCEYLLKCGYEE